MAGQERDSITGWQERFPLPDSLDNPEFHTWVHSLRGTDRLRLAHELTQWQYGDLSGITLKGGLKDFIEEAGRRLEEIENSQ